MYQQNHDKASNQESGFYFQWHFTSSCNLRCSHCYQDDYSSDGLSVENLLDIAKKMDGTLKTWGLKGRVSLTGGEPFKNLDKLYTILSYFNDSETVRWTGILTNGTLIDNDIAKKLCEYETLKEVQVSLDGASALIHNKVRGNNSFERATEGLKLLRKSGLTTAVMYTVTAQNCDEVLSAIDYAADLGVSAITIERATPVKGEMSTMSSQEVSKMYADIMKKKKALNKVSPLKIRTSRPLWCLTDSSVGGFCPVALSCLTIMHDGTILPCRRLEIPIGNIQQDTIYKVWYTSEVLWKLRDKNMLDKSCGSCELLSSCGGCRALAYAVSGDYMGKDPHCWKH